MLDLEVYFPKKELDRVLCCAQKGSDFRKINALIS